MSCETYDNALRYQCRVSVQPPRLVQISAMASDGLGFSPTVTGTEAAEQDLTLMFLRPQMDYTVTASVVSDPSVSATTTLKTGTPPTVVGSWLEVTGEATMPLIGGSTPCSNTSHAVIYDTVTGDLLWYQLLDEDGSFTMRDMVRFTERGTIVGETDNAVVEVDLLGNEMFKVLQAPNIEYHHDQAPSNGHFYMLYKDGDKFPTGSVTAQVLTLDSIEVLDYTGTRVANWNSWETFDIPPDAKGNWFHANSIYLDYDGHMLVSFWAQQTLAKLNGDIDSPDFGETIWLMGAGEVPPPIGSTITTDWSGIDGNDFMFRQHSFQPRADGRYMVLDNGAGRGLLFSLDETTKTAVMEGSYATAENSCGGQGTAAESPTTGNPVVACATSAVREYDLTTSMVVWEGKPTCRDGGAPVVPRWYPLPATFGG